MAKKKKKTEEEIKLPPLGKYANFVRVQYNPGEIVMDFGQETPETKIVRLHTRIVTSPQHAFRMCKILERCLRSIAESVRRPKEDKGEEPHGQRT